MLCIAAIADVVMDVVYGLLVVLVDNVVDIVVVVACDVFIVLVT